MSEKIPRPEDEIKSPTAMELAYAKAQETKEREEKAFGEVLGNDIWKVLSSSEEMQKLEEKGKGVDVDVSTAQAPQYMSRQRRVGFQEEINSLGHTPETSSMAIANQNLEQLHQIETKPGLATEWQPDAAPLGRVMPRIVPTDTEPLIQVETKSLDAVPVDEYMELIQNMYKGQPIPLEVQAVYEDIQKSTASNDDVAKNVALEKLRGFVTKQQEVVSAEIDTHIATENGESESAVIPTGDLTKERVFDENAAEYVDFKETAINKEGTPKEWRDKLRGLINGAKEKVSWYKSSEEKLIRRNAELDADLDKIGGVEKLFRTMGEKYNKLGWKSKIAVGTSLGLGTAFSAGVSLPITLACMSGIAVQRIAGLSTMYLKFEKKSHEEAWGKEKAFLKATVYTAVMGLAIKEGIEYVSETESAHVVQKWLGEALGHFSLFGATHAPEHVAEVPKISASTPEVATQSAVVASPEVAHSVAAAATGGEIVASAAVPEIPEIEVTATPGHGYEYMMKRLWEQLQEKNIKLPSGANSDSDLAKLLAADKNSIDGVVRRLAQDNEWFKENGGTSAVIGEHTKMTIDSHGDIWIDHKDIIAPESASVTPAYHAGAEAPHVSEITEGKNFNIDDGTRQNAQEFVAPLKSVTPPSETLADAGSSGAIPDVQVASASSSEVPLAPVQEHSVINNSGFEISTTQPHLYSGKGDSIFAYGGQKADRMKEMLNYLTSHPDKTIIAADSSEKLRAVWSLVEGKLEQGPLITKPGLFFSIPDSSPSPDDLGKIIK